MGLNFRAETVSAWGRLTRRPSLVAHPSSAADIPSIGSEEPRLALGLRRSYGDVALADRLVDMTGVSRFRFFDPDTGVLTAEAGVSIDEVLSVFAPRGWFLPVVPGTRFVTLGGAVANDVHGKNHHSAGTFGRHVVGLSLYRSDRGLVRIGPELDPELFAATIGGLGLTGIIVEVAVRLQRIASTELDVVETACANLDEVCDGLAQAEAASEHTVAWIDCTARGRALGRGLLTRADWARRGAGRGHERRQRLHWPTGRIGGLLNPLTLKTFNSTLFRKGAIFAGRSRRPYEKVFHPLDSIAGWNGLYGPKGFHQYQCVIPRDAGREPVREMLGAISAERQGSFLAVLKGFGDLSSPGLLSFPCPGLTLALDFPNGGQRTLGLFQRLDAIVAAAGGRLYPAKDARMPAEMFTSGYPQIERFRAQRDPACVSDFSARVGL